MSTWKKYGGIYQHENTNSLTVGSITTDFLTVRQKITNTLITYDSLNVTNHAVINILDVSSLNVNSNGYYLKNIYIYQHLYLDENGDVFMCGKNGSVGLNTDNPQSTFDISGSNYETLNVITTQPVNRNIVARNVNNQGIVLLSDKEGSIIQFFNETPIQNYDMSDPKIYN